MGSFLRQFAFLVESVSRRGPRPMGWFARSVMAGLAFLVVAAAVVAARWYVDSTRYVDSSGVRLEGSWEYRVGDSESCGAEPCLAVGRGWRGSGKVLVPRPLEEQLSAEERGRPVWLRTRVRVPDRKEPLALSLGSIKGAHTVWVNGIFLGSGGEVAFGFYRLPSTHVQPGGEAEIVVSVGASVSPWRGIVHISPMQIGRAAILAGHEKDYQFQTIAKPLFPVIFKLSLFFVFSALFVLMPMRREYMWFGFYAFASSMSALGYWRLHPLYEDFHARSLFVYAFETMAVAAIPMFTAEFLRFNRRGMSAALVWGAVLAFAPAAALLLVDRSGWVKLFLKYYEVSPWFSVLPAAILSAAVAGYLGFVIGVRHRAMQVGVLSVCLAAAFVHKASLSGSLFQFLLVRYPEILDAGIFTALGVLMAADFRGLQGAWQRSSSALPVEVARLASAGVRHALLKSEAVIVVVDAVGYTRQLERESSAGKDALNQALKDALFPIVQAAGGEKISDTGDGSVYRWELGAEEEALYAAQQIAELELHGSGLRFRVGVASGLVTCHYRNAEYSYLGEPINKAARLQSAAQVGTVLVDESVDVPESMPHSEAISYLIKGQRFVARALGPREAQGARAA